MRCASFKPFWHLALASQAPVAIVLEGPRRFRGAVLFRGPRPSSMLGAPFWPSGLTVRRSRPPSAAAELRAFDLRALIARTRPLEWPGAPPARASAGVVRRRVRISLVQPLLRRISHSLPLAGASLPASLHALA